MHNPKTEETEEMAITFYRANEIKELTRLKEEDTLHFEEELFEFLSIESYERLGPGTGPLLGLDPYGDPKILRSIEIEEIIMVCEKLKGEFDEEQVQLFSNELIKFCVKALEQKKNIIAVGD